MGADLSPARAQGGLTQQCLAAAHPETASGPGREALSARYDVVLLPPGARAPVTEPGPPGRLFLTSATTLPPGLVLVDTPDFDSVVRENRLRSEALLVTVDVVVFVVSRHTYQNAALVDVVQQAVGRGRPWVVVYNEAPELETVRAHLDKLAADVGAPPFARYRSPHDPEVEAGRRGLTIEPVDGGPGLAELLGDPARGAALRTRGPRGGAPGRRRRAPDAGERRARRWPASQSGSGRGSATGSPRWGPGPRSAPCRPTSWSRPSATSSTRGARYTGGSAVRSAGSPRRSARSAGSSGPRSVRRGPRR